MKRTHIIVITTFFITCSHQVQACTAGLGDHEQKVVKYHALTTVTTEEIRKLALQMLDYKKRKILPPKNHEGLTDLHHAVIENLPITTEILLSEKVNVNEYSGDHEESDPITYRPLVLRQHPHGWTALHFAARARNSAFMRILLAAGASVNAQTKDEGLTALHIATYMKSPECVALLMEHEADPFALSLADLSPVLCAAQRGDAQTFIVLVEKATHDPEFRNRLLASRTRELQSPLALATQGNHTEVAEYLKQLEATHTSSL